MLKSLTIKNVGLISNLTVAFGPGLTVLTGETGAGKSMILSSLTMVLGERADTDMVRQGEDTATAEALFDAATQRSASAVFDEQGIVPEEGEFVIRRVIRTAGKSRTLVNGSVIGLAALRAAGETMVDIHGQHDHQSLLRTETHLPWLDHYLGAGPKAEEVAKLLAETRALERDLTDLIREQQEREAQREFLEYKIEELEKADIQSDEEQTLENEQKVLAHAETIRQTGAALFEKLYEADGSIISAIESAVRDMERLKGIDPFFGTYTSLFTDIAAQLSDAAMEVQSFCSGVEDDPARLETIDERIALLEKLKRKYRCDNLPRLMAMADEARRELASIETADEERETLEARVQASRATLCEKARDLHKKRIKGVAAFKKEVERELAGLNMPAARFEVAVTLTEESGSGLTLEGKERKIFPHGAGEFQFLISANEGHPPLPLVKIASGGEISRIMLALKKGTGKKQPVPVLVFDEVDAGIGGKTADLVGEKLKELSKSCQILCITHLPQIARQADHHFVVAKAVKGKKTEVSMTKLDDAGRVEELARMGAGKEVTDAAREHARQMIAR